ncbi:hypothetical protein [Fodinibius halophilus]|uniref:Uncharacterized protein n=1 Tax=Fodinibius halophilus TaxID=1736908 RepID=A0A6M1SUT7_9BACT|nr:hypothetical protein [Fodinibius halophilus]NGP87336.1 hypothetical protein [Fodinibius halophilus]
MIRLNTAASVMEFTSFKKKDNISEDTLLEAVMDFEDAFLSKQEGITMHCLVKNNSDQYANVMFVRSMEALEQIEEEAHSNEAAQHFFSLLDMESVEMKFHSILKEEFALPDHFSCVEHGTFSLNGSGDREMLLKTADKIESEYLSRYDNTRGYFIGRIDEKLYSEITLGKTFDQTKQICEGYREEPVCQLLLQMADEESMQLGFWYLIA